MQKKNARSRDSKEAKKSAERIKNRLEKLHGFLDANGQYIVVLRDYCLSLSSNTFTLQKLELKNTAEIGAWFRLLEDRVRTLGASISNLFEQFKTFIGIPNWVNTAESWTNTHNSINGAWEEGLPKIEESVSREVVILSKDVRELMRNKKLVKEQRRVLEFLIKAEEEMNKLK